MKRQVQQQRPLNTPWSRLLLVNVCVAIGVLLAHRGGQSGFSLFLLSMVAFSFANTVALVGLWFMRESTPDRPTTAGKIALGMGVLILVIELLEYAFSSK